MIINFDDPEGGWDLEINTDTKLVYFKRQDYETSLRAGDEFEDWFGSRFRVLFPLRSGGDITIECLRWVTIARIKPTTSKVTT